ncbi:hypothetical protein [Streptomyces sp. NPDC001340]
MPRTALLVSAALLAALLSPAVSHAADARTTSPSAASTTSSG